MSGKLFVGFLSSDASNIWNYITFDKSYSFKFTFYHGLFS